MTDLSGALCRGLPLLFESTDRRDHEVAKTYCERCPAAAACLALLREVQAASAGCRNSGGGPQGTWAGKLIGKTGKEPRDTRRKPLPREHGTDRGYHQHRHLREAACAECKAAHVAAWHDRKVSS